MLRRLSVLPFLVALAGCGVTVSLGEPLDAGSPTTDAAPATDGGPAPPTLTVPLIGPEIGTDPPVATAGTGALANVAVAFDGAVHLAVWVADEEDTVRLRAARFDTEGNPMDPVGFPIAEGVPVNAQPLIAANADGVFAIVWAGEDKVQIVRMRGSDGALIRPDGYATLGPVPIYRFGPPQSLPAIAAVGSTFFAGMYDGAEFLVCVMHGAAGYPIRLEDCTRLDPGDVQGADDWLERHGDGLYAVHRELFGDIVVRSVTETDAGPVFGDRIDTTVHAGGFRAASNGEQMMFAWTQCCTPERGIVTLGQRVDADFRPLDDAPVELMRRTTSGGARVRRVVPTGDGFLVATAFYAFDEADKVAQWVRLDGATGELTAGPTELPSYAFDTTATVGNTVALLTRPSDEAVELRFIDAEGEPSAPHPAGVRANQQIHPSLATSGDAYLLSWVDDRPSPGVYAVRVGALDGEILDATAIAVSEDVPREPGALASAFFDGRYLVLWETGGQLQATLLEEDGRVAARLGTLPIDAIERRFPVVSHDAHHFVIGWSVPGADAGVYLMHLDRDGAPVDTSPRRIGTSGAHRIALAPSGDGLLVAWTQSGGGTHDVLAALLDRDGALGPAQALGTSNSRSLEATSTEEGELLVTFSETLEVSSQITGVALSPTDATPLGSSRALVERPEILGEHALSADTLGFMLSWNDERGFAAARFTPRGEPVGDAVILMQPEATLGVSTPAGVALASSAPGVFLATTTRIDPELAIRRVRSRFLVHSGWPGLE